MQTMGREQFVSVTHFINPQLFWYHKIDVPNEHFHRIIQLEEQLVDPFKNKNVASSYLPRVGDLVAVKFMSWNKCIRGRIEEIVQFRSSYTEYIVWATDYGFPFQTKLDYIRSLPEEYAIHIDHIRHGSLAFLLPGEKEFDFMEGKAKMSTLDHWCQRACDSLEKFISDAASVTFIEYFQTSRSHFWGDLKIINHNGISFLASEFLIGINMAVEEKTNFREICPSLKCMQIPRWLSNNRNNKFKHNVLNPTVSNRRKNPVEQSCDDFSKQKVEDWCARNERFGGSESFLIHNEISACSPIDNNGTSVADEIGFEDSMSVKHEPLYKISLDTEGLDETEQRGFMRSGASAFEINISEAHTKKKNPKSELSISNSNSQNVSNKADNTAASSRRQELIEMRKKLTSYRSTETESISSTVNNLEYQKLNESTSDETSASQNTNKSERLSEIRKKLLSKSGSAAIGEDYRSLSELLPSSADKGDKASSQNLRAKQLLEIRRKYAASTSDKSSTSKLENNAKSTMSSNVKNDFEPPGVDQLKQDSNDKEDTISNISSGSNSTFTSLLKTIREKRIRDNQSADNKRNNDKADHSGSTSSAAALSYTNTLKNNKENANIIKETKETLDDQNHFDDHDKEDTMSIVSTAATSYIESLKNTRKKVHERRLVNLQHNSTNNDQSEQKFVDLKIDKSSKNYTNSNQKSSDPYEGITMLPAGFDLGKLCTYRDEENHWHRKKTTRNDNVPHNFNKSYEISQNNTKTSDDIWDMNENDSKKTSKPIKEHSSSNQNFRHTRSHTDKFKNGNSYESPIHDLEIEKLKSAQYVEKSLLDSTVPDINTDTLIPNIGDDHNNIASENETIDTTNENLINLNSTVEDTLPPPPDDSTQGASLRKYKRRTLKPPAQQMHKMEQLLRRAKLEKEQGNTEILDLDASNLNGRSDSDTNSGVETTGSTFLESHSSNSADSIAATKDIYPATKDKDKQNDNRNSQSDDSNDAMLKLEKLAQQLHKELGLSNEKNCKIVETVIKLPQAQQIREISGERKLQTKFIEHMVLAHSKVPQNPLEKLTDAFLLPEIHEEMINMRVTKVYRIQAYSWPHLLRGNSLFVVNPVKSGKTWCYIPAICNLVSYRLQNSSLPQTYGPVAIIMVASARHVESLSNYCRRLLINSKTKITTVPAFGIRNSSEVKIELLNSCGILVATPAYLVRLLKDTEKESLIDPGRLQHFIIDDLDLILSRFKKDFDTVVRGVFKMARKPHQHTIALQIIVTSRDWNPVMMSMIRWANQPLLLIGDFLEAAVYGKTAISVKLRSNEKKIGSVLRFIEQHPVEHERLLILCNCDDDMKYVVRTLVESGHACIGYGSDSGPESVQLRIAIEEWKNKVLSSQVLVCTDSALPDLKLRNAQNLIHYSMPTSWTKFTARFASLAENYENLISTDFLRSQHYKTFSLILLDEDNNMQLPRLIDFMKKHNQIKNIHSNILAVSKRVLVEREELRIFKGALLCPILLEFGDCDEPRCDNRHNLTRFDLITKNDDIPTEGDMRIQILKVFSPTWYSARLLSHKSTGSTKWKIIRRSDEAALFGIKLNMHYMNMDNWIAHWPPKINDICIYKTSSETYQRARILDVPHILYPDIIKVINVTIKLIDLGTIISSCKSDELLVCDKQFKDFPAQAVDVRLMGVVPFDNERTWDSKATKVVQRWIMSDINEKECVHVNINFALANTVWVKNLIVMERLPTVREYIYRVNLKRSLVHKNFGVCDKAVECRLKAMQEEVNKLQDAIINDDQEIIFDIQQISTDKQDIDTENENTSCNALEDSINLIQFSPKDQDLLNSKEKNVETKKYTNMAMEALGRSNYISERRDSECWDEINGNNSNKWIEIPILNESDIIDKNKSNSFDDTNSISTTKETLKTKTEHFKLEERWCRLPLNKIAGVEIGDENENGNWCDIYMQCIDKYQMQQFSQLNILINEHIKNLKKLNEKKPAFDSNWLQPKQNCIVKYDNLYCRAKIYGIFGKEIGKQIYRFFLCDYACFVTVNAEDLFSDFLYETSCEIIEYTPYQAVYCKLAGITLKPFGKRYPVTKDYLYAYAVQERTTTDGELADFEIFSYDILLYECSKANDFDSATLFNMTLIDNNVATLDPATKHFLQCSSRFLKTERKSKDSNETEKSLRDELVSFEEFLEIFNNLSEDDSEDALDIVFDFKRKAHDIKETTSNKTCQSARDRMLMEKHDVMKTNTNDLKNDQSSTNGNHDQLMTESFSRSLGSADSTGSIPLVKALHKRPHTEWYQTDCLIFLAIHAPDINDYFLNVTKDTLVFEAYVNNDHHVLVLNFLGNIEPQHVSHEIRGLKIIVRLVKSFFMEWPRLLVQSNKFPWLSYNYNALDLEEIHRIRPEQRINLNSNRNFTNNESDEDDADGEEELYQTFTPIVNSEDFHDPTADLF